MHGILIGKKSAKRWDAAMRSSDEDMICTSCTKLVKMQ